MYVNGMGNLSGVRGATAVAVLGAAAASPAAITVGTAVATGYLAQRLLRDRRL